MKICIVLSTRPEIIKLSPLINIFKKKKCDYFIINTNQHFISSMSDVFFKHFNIKKPKYNIRAPNKTYGNFFSKTIKEIEKILTNEKPNYLLVQGDTNTAFAGCFAASIYNRKFFHEKDKLKIVHVEAGLRSFDDNMPEEINRKLIDLLSNILFVPTNLDFINLKKERLTLKKKIYVVGNTISDVIRENLRFINNHKSNFQFLNEKKNYFLVTLHRPESVDSLKRLQKLIHIFEKVGKMYNKVFIFPIHPRTKKKLSKINIKKFKYLKIIPPLKFLDFLYLMKNSDIVFTDSGGIQEETSLLGVPCVTLRTTTERQISLIDKSNILVGYNQKKLINAIKYFKRIQLKPSKSFGDGNVSKKIFNIMNKINKKEKNKNV